jgi:hypothetical protein
VSHGVDAAVYRDKAAADGEAINRLNRQPAAQELAACNDSMLGRGQRSEYRVRPSGDLTSIGDVNSPLAHGPSRSAVPATRPLRGVQVELELVQRSLAEGSFECGALPQTGHVGGVKLGGEACVEALDVSERPLESRDLVQAGQVLAVVGHFS